MKKVLFIIFIIYNSLTYAQNTPTIYPGAYSINKYLPLIKNKNVAIVGNHTSLINHTHLLDTLLSLGIKVKKVFCPEHGFRGHASAGEKIHNGIDKKTGIPIISLYGRHKKPTITDLADIDIVLFDLQDVGVRFYTYISTLQYVMEACADNGKKLIILDRPNPNGFYIAGPVLDTSLRSFIGMQPVPIVYGMTIGEYAKMLYGEKWLHTHNQLDLQVIKCTNYTHSSFYKLPVPPSPNLRDMQAVYLYPSLCLLEGTIISVGRGTNKPFRIFGAPFFPDTLPFAFVPKSNEGAKHPKFESEKCYGFDISNYADTIKTNKKIILDWLLKAYILTPDSLKRKFFRSSFNKLAGVKYLKKDIINSTNTKEIEKKWQKDLCKFKKIRKKYLLYPE